MIQRHEGAILFTAGQSGIYPTYAEHVWDRYAKRDKPEVLVGNFNGGRSADQACAVWNTIG